MSKVGANYLTMTRLLKEVRTEAYNLKLMATTEELDRLDIDTLDPETKQSCIYGQMTGSCQSVRAYHLMNACAVSFTNSAGTKFVGGDEFKSNWETYETSIDMFYWQTRIYNRTYTFYSPVEVYILEHEGNPIVLKALVDYLKGNTDKLELYEPDRNSD